MKCLILKGLAVFLPVILSGCNSKALDCSGDQEKLMVRGLFNKYYTSQGLGLYIDLPKTTYDFDGITTRDKTARTAICEASIKPNFLYKQGNDREQNPEAMKTILMLSGLNMNFRRVQYELQLTDDNQLFVTGKFLN